MGKSLNIALIGAGFIADYHARALQKIEGVKITSVAALSLKAAQEFAKKYSITFATDDALELAARSDTDAAIIGTPNKFHAPFARAFLKNGKDVFLEKPMAMNAGEGKSVEEIAHENGQLVMVGHMWRFDSEVNYNKSVLESGKLGSVYKTKGYGIHENWGPGGWFTEKELAGGGALADMGVHAIDTVRYILGDPRPVQVYAKIGTHFGDYNVDDSGMLMITWDNGVTSLIESGWWQPHMDGPEAATRLFATKGYASLFPTLLKFKVGELPGEFKAPMPEKREHCDQIIYDRQMAHFIECIKQRKNPIPGISEGMVILDIVDAAYKSSNQNQVVNL